MELYLVRIALIFLVGAVVGATTYVVLLILEILREK